MKFLIFILPLLLSSGCIRQYILPDRPQIIHSDFIPFLKKFIEQSEQFSTSKNHFFLAERVSNLNIVFSDLNPKKKKGVRNLGLCTLDVYNQPLIVIDRKFWRFASDIQKEFVLFHELGHCVLFRKHKPGQVEGMMYAKIKSSIMNPRAFDALVYEMFRGYYLFELFNSPKEGSYDGNCNLSEQL